MNDNCAKISIFANCFLFGDGRHNVLRKRYRLISKLMNLDNSSVKNYGISIAFSPYVWIYTLNVYTGRGRGVVIYYPNSGLSRAYQLDNSGYAPFCI